MAKMKSLVEVDVEEIVLGEPPKTTVHYGDVFLDIANNYQVMATAVSNHSGQRYISRLSEDGKPDTIMRDQKNVPDSFLLDDRHYKFLYSRG
jgi:hypothetical protein